MLRHAGRSTRTVYVDVTLTRSKVKVTEHLNFRQLPIMAHFHVCLLCHFCVELKLTLIVWDLDYSLSEPDFRLPFYESYQESSNFAECRHFATFKWPYFCSASRYNHMVGRTGSTRNGQILTPVAPNPPPPERIWMKLGIYITCAFSALTLLIGQQKGHLACYQKAPEGLTVIAASMHAWLC